MLALALRRDTEAAGRTRGDRGHPRRTRDPDPCAPRGARGRWRPRSGPARPADPAGGRHGSAVDARKVPTALGPGTCDPGRTVAEVDTMVEGRTPASH